MEIYHYCNMIKFERILESKKVWLTPVQTMNDGTEVDHLYKVIWPKVKEIIITEIQPSSLDHIQNIFNFVDSSCIFYSEQMPNCACFSDDGDLLSQWCRYAEDGTGVSIGFNSDYFKIQTQPPHPNVMINNSIGIGTVIYDYDLQISILSEIIKMILRQEIQSASCWIRIIVNLTHYSPIFKNQSFFTEQEKRIIYYFTNHHADQFNDKFLTGPYDYKYNNTGYKRFELSWFDSSWNHAITKIVMGPKCQLSSSEVINKLNRFDIKMDESQILRSTSSYR